MNSPQGAVQEVNKKLGGPIIDSHFTVLHPHQFGFNPEDTGDDAASADGGG